MNIQSSNNSAYDITIRKFLLFLIVAWCLLIMEPFVHIMIWGLILGLAFLPLHTSLTKLIGGRPKLASTLIVVISLAIIIIPGVLFLDSIIDGIKEIRGDYQAGTLTIPPPSERVRSWPIIGNKLFEMWSEGSLDLKEFLINYKEQLAGIGSKLVKGVLGATSGMAQLMGAMVIAGILLVIQGTGESIRKFFRKAAGSRGDEFADVVKMTVGNVVRGIMGVAMIQAFLIGIGFLLADIPFAGLWTLLVFIFALLQLPPALVILPVIAYMFSEKETLPAVLWTIYLLAAGLSDNVLKPILLGKGAPVPMLVIFLGVVGGFIFSGFIGLFTGAIVMSVGYKLFISWINTTDQGEIEDISE